MSCSSLEERPYQSETAASSCFQSAPYQYTREDLPTAVHEKVLDAALTQQLSTQALNIANAIGLLEPITDYLRLLEENAARPSTENSIQLIRLMQQINQRINVASLEISAVASKIDCEEERAEQIASFLKAREDDKSTRLTVGAIIAGAAGAVASGVELVGIGTGLLEATLGFMILRNEKSVTFHHQRNDLRDIWNAPEVSGDFPASVWYYLNYMHPNEQRKTLREQLIDRWLEFSQLTDDEEDRDERLALYFDAGGEYTAEQLRTRANMLDQLEAHITLMKQDLLTLAGELP